MKKFIAGIIVGVAISLTGSVFAGSSFSGKKVDGEISVTLDGKSVANGAVIEGTSLLPVRSITEALGLSVSYSKGVINLTSSKKTYDPYDTVDKINARISTLEQAISEAEKSIIEYEKYIEDIKKYMAEHPEENAAGYEKMIEGRVKMIAQTEERIGKHKAEIASLKIKLAELESTK